MHIRANKSQALWHVVGRLDKYPMTAVSRFLIAGRAPVAGRGDGELRLANAEAMT